MEYVRLRDLVSHKKGFAFKSELYSDSGTMVVRVSDFTLESISDSDAVYIEPSDKYEPYKLSTGDILIQTVGSWANNPNSIVGKVVRVPQHCHNAYLNQNIVRIEPNDAVDKTYLFYSLLANHFSTYCVNRGQGAANQASITLETILKFKFQIHNKSTQTKIASILFKYDQLIENNNRRIRLLEQMAENLYKEWFVRFRFPGHEKVEMENGLPKGWKIESVCKSPYFKLSKSPIKNFSGFKHYFATADVEKTNLNSEGEIIDFYNKPSRAQISPSKNSIWFARMINSYKILSFNNCNEELRTKSILSSGFVGFETSPEYYGFMYALISSKNFDMVKDMYCTGSTQISLTNSSLEKIKYISPISDIVKQFSMLVTPIIEEVTLLRLNIKSLKKQRDLLLPRLMSGKIAVNA